ncbi:hypothetical protein F1880_007734 [Penicillium rolfsii]|nr:hypothetical protein F1880_007734 [Penicillium rolfsii]
MEILIHVSAPSAARDDARYRAQVAAIASAFEPVSLISGDRHDRDRLPLVPAGRPPPPPADVPETAENAEPADSSLLLQESEPISAPDSFSSLVVETASAAIADQVAGAGQTSSDSFCDRDLKDLDWDQRRKNPLGYALLPRTEEVCLEADPSDNGNDATISNPNPNPNPPYSRHDPQPTPPSPCLETDHSRPKNPPVLAQDQNREADDQIIAINTPPQVAPDSLGSVISVIPDSQPEGSGYAQQSCQSPATKAAAQPHEADDHPSRAPKRRRVEPCSPQPLAYQNQTIGTVAASEGTSTVTLDSAHHIERGLASSAQSAYPHPHTHPHPNISLFPPYPPNPTAADADPTVSVTKTRHDHQEQRHHHHTSILSTLPLSLRPPPPPISTSTFTTHITPTLSMLTQRLQPTRTYKPTHQARELDKLERGYWAMHINVISTATESEPTHGHEKLYAKDGAGAIADSGSGLPHSWTETQFTRFWTFLSDFIAKEARAGWGVWCIVDRVEVQPQSQSHRPRSYTHTTADITHNSHVPVQLRVYAWGEVAMHIYLLLYLASERRVRGLGLQWLDSLVEVVI